MFHKKTLLILSLCSICFLTACSSSLSGKKTDKDFDQYTSSLFTEMVSRDGITLHATLLSPSDYGIAEDICQKAASTIPDQTFEAAQDDCNRYKEIIKELQQYDDDMLKSPQIHTKNVLLSSLSREVSLDPYLLYRNPFASGSLAGTMSRTFYLYDFRTKDDVNNYLSLLSQAEDILKNALDFEQNRREAGIYLNKVQLQNALHTTEQLLQASDDNNIFICEFNNKIDKIDDLSQEDKKEFQKKNLEIVHTILLPAYQNFRKALQHIPVQDADHGRVCDLPDGKSYYQVLLSALTGTDLTVEEAAQGLTAQLNNSRQIVKDLYQNNPELEDAFLLAVPEITDYQKALEELSYDTLIEFPEIDSIDYNIIEMPDALSSNANIAFYRLPAIDKNRNNNVYINSATVDTASIFPTLAHETFPGHMYQVNYAISRQFTPIQYLFNNAGYDEGWGLYSQIYSYKFQNYTLNESDTNKDLQDLFAQKDLINTSLLCLSDIYVNYNGYTSDELYSFLSQYGIKKEQASSVYQTVIASPGNYLPYGLGYIELVKLRDQQKEKLGKKFDLKEFHKTILDAGSCTFPVLKDWCDQTLSAH